MNPLNSPQQGRSIPLLPLALILLLVEAHFCIALVWLLAWGLNAGGMSTYDADLVALGSPFWSVPAMVVLNAIVALHLYVKRRRGDAGAALWQAPRHVGNGSGGVPVGLGAAASGSVFVH